ncbi:unnamed protein product [Urochloa humidicola]
MVGVEGPRAGQAAEGAWRPAADTEWGRALLTSSPPFFFLLRGRRRKHPASLERGSELVCAGVVDEDEEERRLPVAAAGSGIHGSCLPWNAWRISEEDQHHQMVILPRLTEELYEL